MLKNLIGQNLNGEAAKKGGKPSAASNLLSSANKNLNKEQAKGLSKKGFQEEFSKLLHGGKPKANKALAATNEAEANKAALNSQIGNKDLVEQLKEVPSFSSKENFTTLKQSTSPKATLFSTLSENNKKASASDLDSILGTKNIVELQKARTTLANELGSIKKVEVAPELARKGVNTSALLGKNTQAVLSQVEGEQQEVKNADLLRMAPNHLLKGDNSKKAHLKLQTHSSNDFLMNRNVVAGNQIAQNTTMPKIASGIHLNKFANEAAKKNESLIRVKPENANISNDLDLESIKNPTSSKSNLLQNNLIGSLGATNSTNNFRPEINISKSSEVLDLSNVSNADQMIKEVTNYIEMNRIENGKSLQVTVRHNDLGQFNITANKDMNGMIALNIEATSIEAKEFFKENEVKLLKNLDMKGIRVADFKIHTATTGQMSDFASQSENFKESKRQHERGMDKISTLESAGNEQDYARQLDSEDSLGFEDFKQARESRVKRWQEFNERLGA